MLHSVHGNPPPAAPPFVPLAKVDRSIHGLHPALRQPMRRATSNNMSAASWLLIQSKKPNPPIGTSSPLFLYFLFTNAAIRPNQPSFVVFEDPSGDLAMTERLILLGSNTSLISLSIGRIYALLPLFSSTVRLYEFLCCYRVFDGYQLHRKLVKNKNIAFLTFLASPYLCSQI